MSAGKSRGYLVPGFPGIESWLANVWGWLESEVAAQRIDVCFTRDSGPQSSDVRFRPVDDRSNTRSGHPGDGRRRLLMTQPV